MAGNEVDGAVEIERPPHDYLAPLREWYTRPLWTKPAAEESEEALEEKTRHVGIRLPTEIAMAMNDHAAACGVTKTTYIRNCILTAMSLWQADSEAALKTMSAIWSNPAARNLIESLFNLLNSLSENALGELSRIVSAVNWEIVAYKTGIPVEKLRKSAADSVASLVAESEPGQEADRDPYAVRIELASTAMTKEALWSETVFMDLFNNESEPRFGLGEPPQFLDGLVDRDLETSDIMGLLCRFVTNRRHEVLENALNGIERAPGKKKFCLFLLWDGAKERIWVEIVCREPRRGRRRVKGMWRVRYTYDQVCDDDVDDSP